MVQENDLMITFQKCFRPLRLGGIMVGFNTLDQDDVADSIKSMSLTSILRDS